MADEQVNKKSAVKDKSGKQALSDENLESLSGGLRNEQPPIPPLQPTADLLPPG